MYRLSIGTSTPTELTDCIWLAISYNDCFLLLVKYDACGAVDFRYSNIVIYGKNPLSIREIIPQLNPYAKQRKESKMNEKTTSKSAYPI
jgi:hypothetical protein